MTAMSKKALSGTTTTPATAAGTSRDDGACGKRRIAQAIMPIVFLLVLAAFSVAGSDPGDWILVWSDEFEGPHIDPNNWSHQLGGHGWGNRELQYYTDGSANSFIEDGKLVIRAVHEPTPVEGRNYTSARITSKGKQSFTYGKIAARIKIPSGQGIWPAFWMMPENESRFDGGWPACGEIDIMESINTATRIHGTLHFGARTPRYIHKHTGGSYQGENAPQDFGGEFYVYSIVWEPGRIRWYCDNTLYSEKTASDWWTSYSDDPHAPFDKPFHIIFNVAVGGNWPGFEVDDSLFPHQMVIDWVRVYNRAPETAESPHAESAAAKSDG